MISHASWRVESFVCPGPDTRGGGKDGGSLVERTTKGVRTGQDKVERTLQRGCVCLGKNEALGGQAGDSWVNKKRGIFFAWRPFLGGWINIMYKTSIESI